MRRKDFVAVTILGTCGRCNGYSSLGANRREALPRSAGNVFVADDSHGALKDLNVIVRWLSQKQSRPLPGRCEGLR